MRVCRSCKRHVHPNDEYSPTSVPYHQKCIEVAMDQARESQLVEEAYQAHLEEQYQED